MTRVRKGFIVLAVSAAAFGQSAYAAEYQFPVRIGDSAASVKEKLGEPDETGVWEAKHKDRLFYKQLGFEVEIDTATQTVDLINVRGESRLSDWSKYAGRIAGGIGMDSTFDETVAALGQDYQNDDIDEGEMSRGYFWDLGPDFYTEIDFWEADYTNPDGKTFPKGSIHLVKFYKKSS